MQRPVPVEDVDLDPREILSPPIVDQPLYRCATAVTVLSFVAHADLEVQLNGSTVAAVTAGFPEPNGETVVLPAPLEVDDEVRARQSKDGLVSDWSATVTVRDHSADYPTGPPRPQISPAPVYECGSRTGVANLLTGGNVWITADGAEVGRVDGCSEHQGVNVNPDYALGQRVRAWFELCGDPSPPSVEHEALPPPTPLPEPTIEPIIDGAEQIVVANLVNGARFGLTRNGIVLGGTWRTWGQRHLVGLSPPFSDGETITPRQRMCPGQPDVTGPTTTVQPCDDLSAPVVHPVQHGDTSIVVVDYEPGAVIRVFVNFSHVATSGGPVVPLPAPIAPADVIHVQQILGECIGPWVAEVIPGLCGTTVGG